MLHGEKYILPDIQRHTSTHVLLKQKTCETIILTLLNALSCFLFDFVFWVSFWKISGGPLEHQKKEHGGNVLYLHCPYSGH